MPRYRLTLEYDGRPFSGWQRQGNAPSVQAALEAACAELDEARPEVIGAGRTDAGVHALAQVAHVDIAKEFPPGKAQDALNAHLRPHPIAVVKAEVADPGFHARFDATGRSYVYRIVNRRADLALDKHRAWRIAVPLDHEAMHEAAQVLVGRHDFTTFRDANCQADTPVKTLRSISVQRFGEEVQVRCAARSFLHRQVRSFVGSLVDVGRGRERVEWIGEILRAADRTKCGPVAPPDGLYLESVSYAPLTEEARQADRRGEGVT